MKNKKTGRDVAIVLSILLVIAAMITYLLGAFYSVAFNIALWSPSTREGVIVGFSVISGFSMCIVPSMMLKDD